MVFINRFSQCWITWLLCFSVAPETILETRRVWRKIFSLPKRVRQNAFSSLLITLVLRLYILIRFESNWVNYCRKLVVVNKSSHQGLVLFLNGLLPVYSIIKLHSTWPVPSKHCSVEYFQLSTKRQNFGLDQIESICRRHNKCNWKI